MDLVIKIARPILEGRAASIEVRKDAEKDWCKTVQEALKQTVLTRSCFNVSYQNVKHDPLATVS